METTAIIIAVMALVWAERTRRLCIALLNEVIALEDKKV